MPTTTAVGSRSRAPPLIPTRIINCTFSGNTATPNGAAIAVFNSGKANIYNSSNHREHAWRRRRRDHDFLQRRRRSVNMRNIILYGNPAQQIDNGKTATSSLTYSILQGGCPADPGLTCSHITDVDPLFVDADGADNTLRHDWMTTCACS